MREIHSLLGITEDELELGNNSIIQEGEARREKKLIFKINTNQGKTQAGARAVSLVNT